MINFLGIKLSVKCKHLSKSTAVTLLAPRFIVYKFLNT
jgi:hypothetical protein